MLYPKLWLAILVYSTHSHTHRIESAQRCSDHWQTLTSHMHSTTQSHRTGTGYNQRWKNQSPYRTHIKFNVCKWIHSHCLICVALHQVLSVWDLTYFSIYLFQLCRRWPGTQHMSISMCRCTCFASYSVNYVTLPHTNPAGARTAFNTRTERLDKKVCAFGISLSECSSICWIIR